jgi:hypothetical protein
MKIYTYYKFSRKKKNTYIYIYISHIHSVFRTHKKVSFINKSQVSNFSVGFTSCRHLLVDDLEQFHHQVIDNPLPFVQPKAIAPPEKYWIPSSVDQLIKDLFLLTCFFALESKQKM